MNNNKMIETVISLEKLRTYEVEEIEAFLAYYFASFADHADCEVCEGKGINEVWPGWKLQCRECGLAYPGNFQGEPLPEPFQVRE